MIAHVAGEIDFGHRLRPDLEERTARFVLGRDEHAAVADDRRGDVGGLIRHLGVAPELLTVVGPDADDGRFVHRDDLAYTVELANHGRGVAGAIGPRLPHQRAVGLVEGDQRSVAAAGHGDQPVAVDERGLADAPRRHRAAKCTGAWVPS